MESVAEMLIDLNAFRKRFTEKAPKAQDGWQDTFPLVICYRSVLFLDLCIGFNH